MVSEQFAPIQIRGLWYSLADREASLKLISYIENLRTESMPRRRARSLRDCRDTDSSSVLRTIPGTKGLKGKEEEETKVLGTLDFTLEKTVRNLT
jgi:hypothetical protein